MTAWSWAAARVRTAVVLAVIVAVVAGCTSGGGGDGDGKGSVEGANPQGGVSVSAPAKAFEGASPALHLSTVDDVPPLSGAYKLFGKPTKIEVRGGELAKGRAVVTLDYPAEATPQQVENLRVLRYEGNEWQALTPEHVDTARHRVSVGTDRFSLWGIGWWDVESAISTTVTKARNLLSTDGVLGIGKRVANPPTVECAYPALTLTLDVEKFVPGAITCTRFDVTDGSRRTLDLYVSNPHFTPFLLDLPTGVRFVEAKPDPDNPYTLLARTMAAAQNLPVAFLPAGGMIRLKVDLSKLTAGAAITATLDAATPLLDLATATFKGMLPAEPTDPVVRAVAVSHEAAEAFACLYKHGTEISRLPNPSAADITGRLVAGARECGDAMRKLGTRLAVAVSRQGWSPEQVASAAGKEIEELCEKHCPGMIRAILAAWEHEPLLMEVGASLAEGANGFKVYRLGLAAAEPPFARLAEVLPDGNIPGFTVRPPIVDNNNRFGGGTLETVPNPGTPCVDQLKGKHWDTWLHPQPQFAAKSYLADDIATTITLWYVRNDYRDLTRDYFVQLVGSGKCTLKPTGRYQENEEQTSEPYQGPRVKGLADFREFLTYVPNADGFHTRPRAALYDPGTGVLALIEGKAADSTAPDKHTPPTLDALKRRVAGQLEYLIHRLDDQLGTQFVPAN
ncbi:hypothetical protein [Embleya sp. NPDC020630]|uniref:hypothetical protein n=1 Tax=Embleya sp. NPDC020630 TaxID=3363979 RepID=UPI0037B92861